MRLSLAEREEISRGLAAGEPVREIARRLGRAPSTVCREVAANGGGDRYRACAADRRAVRLMRRPEPAKLARCPRLREAVESNLELRWSPRQMAGHARFSAAAGVPACFGDPRRPGQRGTENTGALRRKYFPRSTDFRALPQSDPDAVAAELNDRPRQTPGWKSPCQALDEALR